MINKLYGDGIHDDHPAIQEMLDSGMSCVYLPVPEKYYLISKTIKVHSNQELKLDRFTHIKLTDHANCSMLENADVLEWNKNIKVSGGIWDMNHNNQYPNAGHFPNETTNGIPVIDYMRDYTDWKPDKRMPFTRYIGHCIVFNSVKGLYLSDLTILNPVVYGMDIAYTEDFTIENIQFDFFEGSPKLWNLDGIHIEGHCKNGYIHNLRGACHDNTVALTTDDVVYGPIENITIDGIYGEKSHSAVRLLSMSTLLRNIHITNIYGTFYAYAVEISKYRYDTEDRGAFYNITMDHIHASLCEGTVDVPGNKVPFIWIGKDMDIDSLYISHVFRNETHNPKPTIGIYEGTKIKCLDISSIEQTNITEGPMAVIENLGTVEKLYIKNIISDEDEIIVNKGLIEETVNML